VLLCMVIDCLSIVGIYAHICALSWSSPAESHQHNYVPSAHLQSYAPSNCYPSKTSARQKSWTDAGTDGPEGRRNGDPLNKGIERPECTGGPSFITMSVQ